MTKRKISTTPRLELEKGEISLLKHKTKVGSRKIFCSVGRPSWSVLLCAFVYINSSFFVNGKEQNMQLRKKLHEHAPLLERQRRQALEGGQSNEGSSRDISSATNVVQTKSQSPHRLRIAPFDLLIAPTPVQIHRADEDLLLVELQELIILFIKTQLGNREKIEATALEYVLFSDIEKNSWTEGKNGSQDPPRTLLRFNGGVASFVGPDVPSEFEVNEWVESATNALFVAALEESRYNYIEVAQYIVIEDKIAPINPEDIVVNLPSYHSSKAPLPILQASEKPPQPPVNGASMGHDDGRYDGRDIPILGVLVSVLVAFTLVAVALALWIRHNNHAVRVLCLGSKETEEIVDFGNPAPIAIKHLAHKQRHQIDDYSSDEDSDDSDHVSLKKDALVSIVDDGLQNQISLAAQWAVDEASQRSAASDFTFPTVSALSFRNPNPFNSTESFQKERHAPVHKDMMYSHWSGKPPDVDSMYGKRRDESVLKPSYFSAAIEWDNMAEMGVTEKSCKSQRQARDSALKVAQAHEYEKAGRVQDGLFQVAPSSRSRRTETNAGTRKHKKREVPSSFA